VRLETRTGRVSFNGNPTNQNSPGRDNPVKAAGTIKPFDDVQICAEKSAKADWMPVEQVIRCVHCSDLSGEAARRADPRAISGQSVIDKGQPQA